MHKTLTTQKTAERKNDELTQYERLTTHAGVWAGHSNPTRKIPAPSWYRPRTWGGYADGGQVAGRGKRRGRINRRSIANQTKG
jgi:hypothetical protein